MRIALFGFGSLGRALLAAAAAMPDVTVATIVDHAPGLAGTAVEGPAGSLTVAPRLPPAAAPTVLFHATTSDPERATAEIVAALEAGYAVVSAAEWLFHPWLRFPRAAEAIDRAARAAGRAALGCGINPGFCFEALPILAARTLARVDRFDILRISNVSGVGPSDFAHLGFGLDEATFRARVADGAIEGHMGFPESVAALAECTGVAIDAIEDRLAALPARRPVTLAHRTVAEGEAVAITQVATGFRAGAAVITMTLEMHLDPEFYGRTPREAVRIEGSRTLALDIAPAAPPVPGAAAMMLHAARALGALPPGLASPLDLPAGGSGPTRRLSAGPAARDGSGSRFALAG
ncbi:hypothetical protein [Prosthecomicrobium pneumaticum]|uniref:4-hydroxy-tetrahydrodipicolinate reductase n=1 Tax=Prosthecomicrobium pneumaticum TaxID=81895 RepID=A0A7W9L2Q4_9HYPH|nr:hypothetical protein [Prosthecomicrobium pneumaticum]MBB5753729.1 4-hydroxy-tetrahydrodipicolinate reductase [Prosthecomicrobium pneumaticum]